MDSARLQHDCALVMAKALLDLFGPVLRDEEKNDAFWECYRVCKAGVESYVMQRNREMARMNPCRN
jgi:hypothetical protein